VSQPPLFHSFYQWDCFYFSCHSFDKSELWNGENILCYWKEPERSSFLPSFLLSYFLFLIWVISPCGASHLVRCSSHTPTFDLHHVSVNQRFFLNIDRGGIHVFRCPKLIMQHNMLNAINNKPYIPISLILTDENTVSGNMSLLLILLCRRAENVTVF
jgi:hypothetical protein